MHSITPSLIAPSRACVRRASWLRMLVALALTLEGVPHAQAVILTFQENGFPQIILTVGQAGSSLNTGTFKLDSFAKLTSNTMEQAEFNPAPTNAIQITVRVRNNGAARVARLSMGMSTNLNCFAGASSCSGFPTGTFSIPAQKFSWTVTNASFFDTPNTGRISTPPSAGGTFTGSGNSSITLTQFIVGDPAPGMMGTRGVQMSFLQAFRYNNDTRYPAGSYRALVVYNLAMN